MIIFAGIILVLIPLLTCSKSNSVLARWRKKLSTKFLWNFYITLILETTLELCFGSLFNIVYSQLFVNNKDGAISDITVPEWINIFLAAFLGLITFTSPILIGVFYLRNFEHW
jgi:hypothetical protein